ncbi:saccharopine dehydrogenase family protein [Aquipseudomonas alcaligenes]|uniref:saccharopine dehydrogenase family protein n=1 Tax=Aquipseudomonas alcaligenes TaxID=43263 RepID=UPI0037499B80
MSQARNVLVYGASGYTGKLVAESLAQRDIPFYMAGRTLGRLETALGVVQERHGKRVDAELVTVEHSLGELVALLKKLEIKVLINNVGPFMQLGWPVVEACLEAGVHYLDTTGEQDWTIAIGEKYGAGFAAKNLLLCPANSFMWAAGALAAEVVLENPDVDSLDICYQIDNGLPSEASTKSFLRMVCNDVSQYYLEQNEFKAWPNDVAHLVSVPYRNAILRAHPWGGACEPVWFKNDPRVRNCKVLTAIGEHMIDGVIAAIKAFNAAAPGLSQAEREEWTNRMGDQMDSGEPPKDSVDVQRGVIVVHGQGRQVTTSYVMNLSAAYTWTGDICAEGAERLLAGKLKAVGFQSPAKAFGHRELITRFHERGFCSALPA